MLPQLWVAKTIDRQVVLLAKLAQLSVIGRPLDYRIHSRLFVLRRRRLRWQAHAQASINQYRQPRICNQSRLTALAGIQQIDHRAGNRKHTQHA